MADIKTRFTIEGEQQYRKAMSDAANAVKVLNSQQKLAKAQFQNTGDAEKYAASQADILRKKIEQQKTSVKAAEAALKQLSDQGVAANNRQMQQWQIKLNNAQSALEQMEAELKEVNSAMQETGSTANETSNAVENIGKKVSYDAVINGMGKITGAMEGAARKAKELAGDLINTMKEAASWSDDLATKATVYGLSTEELQRMEYTADLIDTSVESIMKSRQKLINNMVYGNDEIQQSFKNLGVETTEFFIGKFGRTAGGFRDWEDVFWDLGEALANFGDVEERNAIANKLLGKSYDELMPLFQSDWAEKGYNSAWEYYEAVMASWDVVSDENVARLNELDDTVQKVENNFETLKGTVLGELAPAFTAVGNTVNDLLTQFNEYLKTEEGQQKLHDLSDAVTNLFSSLTDVGFDTALDLAKTALNSITNGLKWISEHWSEVEFGLKAIGIAFGLMKVAQPVLTFMQLLSSGKFLFGRGGGSGTGSGGGGGSPVVPITGGAGGGMLAGISNALTHAASSAANFFGQIGSTTMGVYGDWFMNQTELGRFFRGESTWEDVMKSVEDFGDSMKKNAETFEEDWANNPIFKFFKTGFETNGKNAMSLIESLFGSGPQTNGLEDLAEDLAMDAISAVITRRKEKLTRAADAGAAEPGYMDLSPYMFLSGDMYSNMTSWWANRRNGPAGTVAEAMPGEFITDDQIEAVQKFWDVFRENGADFSDADWDAYEKAFEGQEELFDAIDKAFDYFHQTLGEDSIWPEDLPDDFFKTFVNPELQENAPEELQRALNSIPLTVPVTPVVLNTTTTAYSGSSGVAQPTGDMRSFNSNLYVESMYMNNGTDADGLAAAMAAAQRRTMNGFGS